MRMSRVVMAVAATMLIGSCKDTATGPAVGDVTLSDGPFAGLMQVGDTAQIVAKTSGGSRVQIEWTSSRPNVISVDRDGLLVALAIGRSEIRGRFPNGDTYITTLEVTRPLATITILPPPTTLVPGARYSFRATARDSAGVAVPQYKTFLWEYSDPSVVRGPFSYVTAVGPGTATVTARLPSGIVGTLEIVVDLVDLINVVAGTCGLSADSLIYCWTGPHVVDPDGGPLWPISAADRFLSVDGGGSYACAVRTDNRAVCWGIRGAHLGIGTLSQPVLPVTDGLYGTLHPVRGHVQFVSVSAGAGLRATPLVGHSCGLDVLGKVHCWGLNGARQLGVDSDEECEESAGKNQIGFPRQSCARSPVGVSGVPPMVQVSAGGAHTCGLTTDRAAYCWGANGSGQLGNGNFSESDMPSEVTGSLGIGFTSLGAGGEYTCGLSSTGTVYCWGKNDYGQLGDGTSDDRNVPGAVLGTDLFTALSVGQRHACALRADGVVLCWGSNDVGESGQSDEFPSRQPTEVESTVLFASISSGGFRTCGMGRDGLVYCWGERIGHVPAPAARQR